MRKLIWDLLYFTPHSSVHLLSILFFNFHALQKTFLASRFASTFKSKHLSSVLCKIGKMSINQTVKCTGRMFPILLIGKEVQSGLVPYFFFYKIFFSFHISRSLVVIFMKNSKVKKDETLVIGLRY